MDPLTAIGLVGNILQFIDFSCKLFERARSIQRSAKGATAEDENLDDALEELTTLTSKLKPPGYEISQSEDEMTLYRLAKNCEDLSADIQDVLKGDRAMNPKSKRQRAFAVMKSTFHGNKKRELKRRLDDCRSQLELQLVHLSRYPRPTSRHCSCSANQKLGWRLNPVWTNWSMLPL